MKALIESISEMTVGELVSYIALIAAGVSAAVEKFSKTAKPLTKLARAIGRAMNKDLMEKVDNLDTKVGSIEQRVERMDQEEQLQRAKDARTRVLRFGDELIHNERHTKEHFDDVLRDITEYERYCDEHPNFENDQMHITAEYIKETYHKCLKEHSFM